jgi:hypothetical protein
VHPNRREVLGALAGASLLGCQGDRMMPSKPLMPVVFRAHGAPPLLDDAGWIGELAAWGQALPRPRGDRRGLAHWEERRWRSARPSRCR